MQVENVPSVKKLLARTVAAQHGPRQSILLTPKERISSRNNTDNSNFPRPSMWLPSVHAARKDLIYDLLVNIYKFKQQDTRLNPHLEHQELVEMLEKIKRYLSLSQMINDETGAAQVIRKHMCKVAEKKPKLLKKLLEENKKDKAPALSELALKKLFNQLFFRAEESWNQLERLKEPLSILRKYLGIHPFHASCSPREARLQDAIRDSDTSTLLKSLIMGADPNQRNSKGNTLLHSAARHSNQKMAAILLEYKADSSKYNAKGETPLDLAVYRGHASVVETLLCFNPLHSRCPLLLKFAERNGDAATVAVIKKHAPPPNQPIHSSLLWNFPTASVEPPTIHTHLRRRKNAR